MKTILIIGVETVAGANIAASYSEDCKVVGITSQKKIAIENCDIFCLININETLTDNLVLELSPDQIILCGQQSESHWFQPERFNPNLQELQQLNMWAVAGEKANCQVTLISSDAVFTGPWMFHSEESDSFCFSDKATFIRELESTVIQSCPDALVVRTNIFGWSPLNCNVTFNSVEELCEAMSVSQINETASYATPILATDFAHVLSQAHQANMTGVCHIAGSERTCQQTFITQLAKEFGLPQISFAAFDALEQRPTGFTEGETSLHSLRVRKELKLPLPMLSTGIAQLHHQATNGYREQFRSEEVRSEEVATARAA